jgi:hypothetical protein
LPEPNTVLHAMGMVNAYEGWMSANWEMLHYKGGQWQTSDNPRNVPMKAIVMLNENEGWAVGNGILHYTNK